MAEMQALNTRMGPLMVRLQTALQGTASPDDVAAIRAEMDAVNTRLDQLMAAMAGARNAGAQPPAPVAPTAMPGMSSYTTPDLQRVERLLTEVQSMLLQIQGQGTPAASSMPGMNMSPSGAMATATPDPSMSGMGMMGMMDMMGMGHMPAAAQPHR